MFRVESRCVALIALAAAARFCVASAPESPAFADHDETVLLEEITITDVRDRVERDGRPLGAYYVPLERGLAGGGAHPTLKSALNVLPGLVVQEGFGGIDPPRVTARGSGLQSAPVSRGLLWTLDGLPLNAADGSFLAGVLEPALTQGLRFRPGALDPLAAGFALGGSIDLETPFTGAFPRLTFATGADGYRRATFSRGASFRHGTAWFAGSAVRSDGWRDHSAQRRAALTGCFTHDFAGDAPMLFVRFYTARPRFDVPGPLTLAAAREAPRTISAATAADQPRRETDFARTAAELQWGGGELRQLSLELAAQTTRDRFRQLRANGIAQTDGDDFTARLSLRRDLETHTVHTGVSHLWGERAQTRFVNLAGAAGAPFAELALNARTSTAWFDDRWKVDDATTITTTLSFVSFARRARGPQPATGWAHGDRLFARIGARRALALGDRSWLALALSHTGEAPTFEDLLAVRGTSPNLAVAWTPLRHQEADTLELAWHCEWNGVTFAVTGHAARWDNELLRLSDARGAPRGAVNAGPTRHRGVDAALRWRVRDGARPLEVQVTHTWSAARFAGDAVYGRNHLAGLPPHAGSFSLESVPEEGWFGVLGATWIGGRIFADHANRLGYGGHVLAQARAGWTTEHWTIALELNNAFNRAYIASTSGVIDLARNPATTALFLPGAPRTWSFALEWRW